MSQYTLKAILSTVVNSQGKRRIIFDGAPVGGISSRLIIALILSLPFLEYWALFNPYVFTKLGIATAILAYIIFLSTTMIIVFFMIWILNRKVIQKIRSSWNHYFEAIDLDSVISSRLTPYSKFFEYYSQGVKEMGSEAELHRYLLESCATMEEENKDLIEAMNRKSFRG